MASVSKVEFSAFFLNAREASKLQNTLSEIDHPQPLTPIVIDNKCAVEISNDTVKKKRSKAIAMQFFWIVYCVKQNMSLIMWRPGSENIADYFSKYHSLVHHQLLRSWYLLCQVDIN